MPEANTIYCPKCGAQNVNGASYCRACGANLSLVPQALSGELPESKWHDRLSRKKQQREPSIEQAVQGIVMGLAFTIVSILVSKYAPGGSVWWFWLLIPAFGCFGKGFSALARLRMLKAQPNQSERPQLNAIRPQDLSARNTGDLIASVPSVTEGTTRHLGADARTRPFELSDKQEPS